jgi:hypothetical protein
MKVEIPSAQVIQAGDRDKYVALSKSLEDKIAHAIEFLEALKSAIKAKQTNLVEEILIPDILAQLDIELWENDFSSLVSSVNDTISNHNKAFDSFKSLQEEAFVAIRNHVFAQELPVWHKKVETLKSSQEKLQLAKKII